MHELPVMEKVVSLMLRRSAEHGAGRVRRLCLRVGALSDFEPVWMERYFQELTRGTPAEGAVLEVSFEQPRGRCADCGARFETELRPRPGTPPPVCPQCGSGRCRLEGTADYTLTALEVDDG